MRPIAFSFALLCLAVPLRAEDPKWDPPPDRLVIGYESEGKVDASPQACEAFVQEMMERPAKELPVEVDEVCGARKRHLNAYSDLQDSYAALRPYLDKDHRLESALAVESFEAMVKACIDHKTRINTGGHNIRSDIIPNDVAAACLKIGKALLDTETDWFRVGFTQSHPAP